MRVLLFPKVLPQILLKMMNKVRGSQFEDTLAV